MLTRPAFIKTLEEAAKLLERREQLIPELDVTEQWSTELTTIENKYMGLVTVLVNDLESHLDYISRLFADPRMEVRRSAYHIVLLAKSAAAEASLLAFVGQDPEGRCWEVAESVRLCPTDVVSNIVRELVDKYGVATVNCIGPIVGQRVLRNFGESVSEMVEQQSHGSVNASAIEVLGYLGAVDCIPTLETLVERFYTESDTYASRIAADNLMLIGSEKALQYYRDAVEAGIGPDTIGYNLGLYGNPADLDLLFASIERKDDPEWSAEIITAMSFSACPRMCSKMFRYLEHSDEDVRAATHEFFGHISGDWGEVDPYDSADELTEYWRSWWAENGLGLDQDKKYRNGELLSISDFVDQMADPLVENRLAAYRRLIIYTGQHLPFDEYAFIEHQEKWVADWREWIEDNREQFPDGAWFRWGRRTD